MTKKLLCLFFLFFMAGCASVGNCSFSSYYIKKKNLMFYHPKRAEFYDLKDRINKQEYRRLPSYLQECYEREEINERRGKN